MNAATRRRPLLAVGIGLCSGLLVLGQVGSAHAAGTASPSPSSSPSASAGTSPSPSASPSASPTSPADTIDTSTLTGQNDTSGQNVVGQNAQELAVGIDRWIPYASTATAVGSNGLASVTLPLPSGLVPIIVRGTVTSVADSPGTVRVRVGPTYATLDAATGGPFQLQVNFAAIVDNSLTIEVRNTLDDGGGKCSGDYTTTETIENLEVGFLGKETPPGTVAGFFSPPVQLVTIVVPDAMDLPTAEAVMATAGAVARRYDRTVPINILTEAEADGDATLLSDADGPNRIVRVIPGGDSTVTVAVSNPGVPTLTLSGPVEELGNAGASLAAPELGLAFAPKVTELTQERSQGTDTSLSFADLGSERPTMSGLGRLTTTLGVPQDRFGGPVGSMTIHIEGAYTPIPSSGQATASILWNEQLVESQLLTDGTSYTADVTVSGPLIRRDNNLTVRVDASPPGGDCGTASQPFQLDLNGFTSTVTATPGQTLREGFPRYPQSFGSDLHVAFGGAPLTSTRVKDACALVVSLQRAANIQLDVYAEDLATFLSAPYSGLVVGATPDDASALKAPLRFEPFRALQTSTTDFSVTVDGPFAALEAFEYDGRNILMLGSTAPAAQAEPLMTQLALEAENGEFGWNGLSDNLMIAQPGAPTVLFLSSDTLIPQQQVIDDARTIPVWLIALVAGLLLILVLRWILLRRRRASVASEVAAASAAPEAPIDEPERL